MQVSKRRRLSYPLAGYRVRVWRTVAANGSTRKRERSLGDRVVFIRAASAIHGRDDIATGRFSSGCYLDGVVVRSETTTAATNRVRRMET